jgi:hypothetical protein
MLRSIQGLLLRANSTLAIAAGARGSAQRFPAGLSTGRQPARQHFSAKTQIASMENVVDNSLIRIILA